MGLLLVAVGLLLVRTAFDPSGNPIEVARRVLG